MSKYPMLEVSKSKLQENVKQVVSRCNDVGVNVTGVVKGFNGIEELANVMADSGCYQLASSRIEQIKKLRDYGISKEMMLIRIPMHSEIKELVEFVDISLNSEISTIKKINEEARKQGKNHKVILMIDLGDLREGIIDRKEAVETAKYIEEELKNITFAGIGTNLGCYGSIKPDENNLGTLSDIAEEIELEIGRELEIISGGATSSLTLILDGKLPKKINNLRIGEGIINAMDLDLFWGYDISFLNNDVFVIKAEVIEVKDKPTYPIGEIFIDAFGNIPSYDDNGIRRRALLGIGKQDFSMIDKLIPFNKDIKIVGASSDHLIIDVQDSKNEINVGDILSFKILYPALLFSSGSRDVSLNII